MPTTPLLSTVARDTEAVKARPVLLEALETTVLPKTSPLPGFEGTEGSEPLDVAYSTNHSVTGSGLFFKHCIKKSSSRGQEAAKVLFIGQFTRQNFRLCILCLVNKTQNT